MKFLLFTLLSFLTLSAVSQNEIVLRFDHMAGDQPLELNTEYAVPDQGNNENITRREQMITQLEFMTLEQLHAVRDEMETWSQLCLDGLEKLAEE